MAEAILRHCPICLQDSIIGHGRRRKQAHDEASRLDRDSARTLQRCGKTFTFLPPFSLPYCHYSLIARSQALRKYFVEGIAAGNRRHPPSKIQNGWPMPPRCADGSEVWIARSRRFRFCASDATP